MKLVAAKWRDLSDAQKAKYAKKSAAAAAAAAK